MSSQKSLKAQNAWLLNAAVLAHVFGFFFVVLKPIDGEASIVDWLEHAKNLLAPGALSLALVVIAALILRGLIQGIF